MVLALALVHHLAISNNVPLGLISHYFAKLGEYLLIEFVPKEDSQVKRLLASRDDIFKDYHAEGFEKAFYSDFEFIRKDIIHETKRTLYLLKRKGQR